jgi:osmotically-inducible protein OsmY
LASANITAKVTTKAVELDGTVPSKDAKEQAEKIAKTNAGDRKIKNHLKVASADKSMDKSGTKDNTATPNPKQ